MFLLPLPPRRRKRFMACNLPNYNFSPVRQTDNQLPVCACLIIGAVNLLKEMENRSSIVPNAAK